MRSSRLLSALLAFSLLPCAARPDALEGDARLAAPRTMEAGSTTLDRLLRKLSEDSGISFSAEPTIAPDRVILYVHDRPLVDTLRELAAFFRFEWRRQGEKYVLAETPASRLSDTANFQSTTLRYADMILDELRFARSLQGLSDAELGQKLQRLDTSIQAAPPQTMEQQKLFNEQTLIQAWRRGRLSLALRILGAMSREEVARLLVTGFSETYYFDPLVRQAKNRYLDEKLALDLRKAAALAHGSVLKDDPRRFSRTAIDESSIQSIELIVTAHRWERPVLQIEARARLPEGSTSSPGGHLPLTWLPLTWLPV